MRDFWNTLPRRLVLFSLPIIFPAFFGAILYLLAPGLLENHLSRILIEEGIEVEQLEVETVGLTGSWIGPGALRLNNQSLEWESMHAGYRPSNLPKGQVDHVTVEKPSLHLRIPDFDRRPELSAGEEPPDYSLEEVPSRQAEEVTDESHVPPADGVPDSPDDPSASRESVMADPLQEQPDDIFDIGDLLGDVPFGGGLLEEGQIEVEWRGQSLLEAVWESQFLNDPEHFSCELQLSADILASTLTLKHHNPSSSLSLFGEMKIEPNPLMQLFRKFAGEFGVEPAFVDSLSLQNPIEADFLWESKQAAPPGLSARMSTSSLQWKPPFHGYPSLTITDLLVLATYRAGLANLQGMGKFASYACRDFLVEPFPFAYSSDLTGLDLHAEAVGIKRNSTLWVEELKASTRIGDRSFDSTFTWYNGAGTHMGNCLLTGRLNPAGNISASVRMAYPDERIFLTSTINKTKEGASLSVNGELSLEWLNALGDWWWGRRGFLSGKNPSIEARLDQSGYLLKGDLQVEMGSLDLVLSNGCTLNDIQGTCRLRINGLPSSDGVQRFRIRTLASGNIRLRNLFLEWSLPTVRNFRLIRASGNIGEGSVYLDPFTCDPFKADFKSSLRFERVPAQTFLDWIGEERFTLEGTVSGQIPFQWTGGVLYIGEATLRMDSASPVNRLLFSDRKYLQQQFGLIKSVPADLMEPLLATLLSDGIRIREMSLDLSPNPEKEEVVMQFRLSGITQSASMEVPIESLVINNNIRDEDLRHVLGFLGPVRFLPGP